MRVSVSAYSAQSLHSISFSLKRSSYNQRDTNNCSSIVECSHAIETSRDYQWIVPINDMVCFIQLSQEGINDNLSFVDIYEELALILEQLHCISSTIAYDWLILQFFLNGFEQCFIRVNFESQTLLLVLVFFLLFNSKGLESHTVSNLSLYALCISGTRSSSKTYAWMSMYKLLELGGLVEHWQVGFITDYQLTL